MRGYRSGLAAMALAMLATATTGAVPASAGMLGAEATSQYYAYGAKSGSASVFTVDGLVHAPTFNTFDVTVTDDQVILDFHLALAAGTWSSSPTSLRRDGLSIRNGNLLSFAGASTITDVTIDAATTMLGLTAANVTFNDGEIAIDWMGRAFDAGTRVVLNVATAAPTPAPVSEPPALATAVLAVIGLAGTNLVRRRRVATPA